jgi:hypothetical protein
MGENSPNLVTLFENSIFFGPRCLFTFHLPAMTPLSETEWITQMVGGQFSLFPRKINWRRDPNFISAFFGRQKSVDTFRKAKDAEKLKIQSQLFLPKERDKKADLKIASNLFRETAEAFERIQSESRQKKVTNALSRILFSPFLFDSKESDNIKRLFHGNSEMAVSHDIGLRACNGRFCFTFTE